MSRRRQVTKKDWANYSELQRAMYLQNKNLESGSRSHRFDPHKYFGGWTPIERSTIESIKLDKRLVKMMEYDDSSTSNNESHIEIQGKESLANPSVAEENNSSPKIPRLKIKNIKSNNDKFYLNEPGDRQAMQGFRNN